MAGPMLQKRAARRWLAPGGSHSANYSICFVRERSRANLNVDRHRRHPLTAFLEPGCAVALRGPQSPALPARLRIVDAGIETLGIEAHRIGDAQNDHLAVDEGVEAVVFVARGNRYVLTETDRIVLIDPGV